MSWRWWGRSCSGRMMVSKLAGDGGRNEGAEWGKGNGIRFAPGMNWKFHTVC